jgi:N-acetylmuramoyl-L-alanine amidase
VCAYTDIQGQYNEQNIYNMRPEEIHYEIADWALSGNVFSPVGNSLFYFNPYNPKCTTYFPPNKAGVFYAHIDNHCFYAPTQVYAKN